MTSRSDLARTLARYTQKSQARAIFQIVNTVVPFVLLWSAMIWSLGHGYWLTVLLAVPTGGLMLRFIVLQHDCGHGSFFRSRAANTAVGFLFGIVTLSPYHYWRYTHALHHKTAGSLDHRADIGYLTLLTVREYLALSPRQRLLYRIYRNVFFLMLVGVPLQWLIKHRYPWDIPKTRRREWASVWATNAALALVVLVFWNTIGLRSFLLIELPVVWTFCVAGGWLFYIQHTFEGVRWSPAHEWRFEEAALRGSSYYVLPRILNWFSADIAVHHVHHVETRIPNYRLRECLRDNRALEEVSRVPFRDSLRAVRLTLWDEERQRMVGYPARSTE